MGYTVWHLVWSLLKLFSCIHFAGQLFLSISFDCKIIFWLGSSRQIKVCRTVIKLLEIKTIIYSMHSGLDSDWQFWLTARVSVVWKWNQLRKYHIMFETISSWPINLIIPRRCCLRAVMLLLLKIFLLISMNFNDFELKLLLQNFCEETQ